MPSFSSVVRKPGQPVQSKGPRKNVQRNPARKVLPPSTSTPHSQTVSPAAEAVDTAPESQHHEVHTVGDRGEIPSITPSTIPSVVPSVETAQEDIDHASVDPESATVDGNTVTFEVSNFSSTNTGIQIIHPISIDQQEANSIPDVIPSVMSTTYPLQKRKSTHKPSSLTPSIPAIAGPRKRQRITPTPLEREDNTGSQTPPSEPLPPTLHASSRRISSESRTSAALLQDATSRAATVSELANDIEQRIRSMTSRSDRDSVSQAAETEESTVEDSTHAGTSRTKKKRKSKSDRIQDLAQRVVDAATNGGRDKDDTDSRRSKRLDTPENAEELEIDPQEVSMSELTADIKIGRKSETEKRMQENWGDIQERRKAEVEKRREAALRKKSKIQEPQSEVEVAAVPQQIIVNGVIVVANESREVAFGAGLEEAVRENADVAIEDDRIYKYVTSGTLGKKVGRDKRNAWDESTTDLFYQGLRNFGTDFSMIANLFPDNVDRRTIKKKYQAELQTDADKVERCVAAKEIVDLDDYAATANMEFEDPDKLMEELAATERRMIEEDEKRRADQGYVAANNEADIPLPSTEVDQHGNNLDQLTTDEDELLEGEETDTPAPTQAPGTARSNRINSLAEQVVQAAVAPKKKQQRRTRESTGAGRGGRGGRKSKKAVEGLEERIGPLEELERQY